MLLLLSHSDTDLLSARAAGGPVEYRFANPARLPSPNSPASWTAPSSSSSVSSAGSAPGRRASTRSVPPESRWSSSAANRPPTHS